MGLKVLSSVVISALFLSTSVITESLAKEYKVKQTRVSKKAKKSKKERKKKTLVHIVDSFSDGSYLQQPEWWRFGSLYLSVENNKMKKKFLKNRFM